MGDADKQGVTFGEATAAAGLFSLWPGRPDPPPRWAGCPGCRPAGAEGLSSSGLLNCTGCRGAGSGAGRAAWAGPRRAAGPGSPGSWVVLDVRLDGGAHLLVLPAFDAVAADEHGAGGGLVEGVLHLLLDGPAGDGVPGLEPEGEAGVAAQAQGQVGDEGLGLGVVAEVDVVWFISVIVVSPGIVKFTVKQVTPQLAVAQRQLIPAQRPDPIGVLPRPVSKGNLIVVRCPYPTQQVFERKYRIELAGDLAHFSDEQDCDGVNAED